MHTAKEIAPLYQRIKDYIAEQIYSGELALNSRVPSEHELVRRFNVSRMTVNRALSELATQGLLKRVPGVGTFVAQTQTTGHLIQVTSIANDVRERGHRYGMDVIANERIIPPKGVSKWMQVSRRKTVFHTVVVHNENGIPIQLEERYVNPNAVPTYAQLRLDEMTPTEFLLSNVPLQRVEHTVRAIIPSAAIRQRLKMRDNVACLVLDRRTWSRDTPISFVHLYHCGDSYALSDSFLPMRH